MRLKSLSLQRPGLTRSQTEHAPEKYAQPPTLGHPLLDGVQHLDREGVQISFTRGLGLGGRLDLDAVHILGRSRPVDEDRPTKVDLLAFETCDTHVGYVER